jgi:ribosomal RNA methyltransferase Nop2
VWNWKKQDEEPYLIPLPREKSPASEVENPEEAALDFDDGIDIDWDDDEVDAALMDDDDEDSDVDVPSDSEAEEENAPNGVAVSVDADSDAAESDYGSSLAGLDQQAEDNADSDAVESDYGSSQNGEEREEFSAGEEEEEAIQHNNTQTYTETDDDDMAGLIEDALDDIDSGSEAEYASSQVPEDEVGSDVDMINTLKRRLVEEHDDEPLERPSKKR